MGPRGPAGPPGKNGDDVSGRGSDPPSLPVGTAPPPGGSTLWGCATNRVLLHRVKLANPAVLANAAPPAPR